MKAVLDAGGGHGQFVTKVEDLVAEEPEAEGRHHIPQADESNLRIRFDLHSLVRRILDAALLNEVTEIERRRGAAAEADDIDDLIIVAPILAERFVRFVQSRQFTGA